MYTTNKQYKRPSCLWHFKTVSQIQKNHHFVELQGKYKLVKEVEKLKKVWERKLLVVLVNEPMNNAQCFFTRPAVFVQSKK